MNIKTYFVGKIVKFMDSGIAKCSHINANLLSFININDQI